MPKIYVANLPKRGKEGTLSEQETIVQIGKHRYQLTEWLIMFFKMDEKQWQETVHQLMAQKTSGNSLEKRSAQHILDLIPAKYGDESAFQEGLV